MPLARCWRAIRARQRQDRPICPKDGRAPRHAQIRTPVDLMKAKTPWRRQASVTSKGATVPWPRTYATERPSNVTERLRRVMTRRVTWPEPQATGRQVRPERRLAVVRYRPHGGLWLRGTEARR